jgi:hypothetical protein
MKDDRSFLASVESEFSIRREDSDMNFLYNSRSNSIAAGMSVWGSVPSMRHASSSTFSLADAGNSTPTTAYSSNNINKHLYHAFVAGWMDGTICACLIKISSDGISWLTISSVKTNDAIYKLSCFDDSMTLSDFPTLIGDLPRFTVFAAAYSGDAFLISDSTLLKPLNGSNAESDRDVIYKFNSTLCSGGVAMRSCCCCKLLSLTH